MTDDEIAALHARMIEAQRCGDVAALRAMRSEFMEAQFVVSVAKAHHARARIKAGDRGEARRSWNEAIVELGELASLINPSDDAEYAARQHRKQASMHWQLGVSQLRVGRSFWSTHNGVALHDFERGFGSLRLAAGYYRRSLVARLRAWALRVRGK